MPGSVFSSTSSIAPTQLKEDFLKLHEDGEQEHEVCRIQDEESQMYWKGHSGRPPHDDEL